MKFYGNLSFTWPLLAYPAWCTLLAENENFLNLKPTLTCRLHSEAGFCIKQMQAHAIPNVTAHLAPPNRLKLYVLDKIYDKMKLDIQSDCHQCSRELDKWGKKRKER